MDVRRRELAIVLPHDHYRAGRASYDGLCNRTGEPMVDAAAVVAAHDDHAGIVVLRKLYDAGFRQAVHRDELNLANGFEAIGPFPKGRHAFLQHGAGDVVDGRGIFDLLVTSVHAGAFDVLMDHVRQHQWLAELSRHFTAMAQAGLEALGKVQGDENRFSVHRWNDLTHSAHQRAQSSENFHDAVILIAEHCDFVTIWP